MNNRNKTGGSTGLQIVDIRKANVVSTINNLDLKPLGASGLALLKEAAQNIAIQLDYGENEIPSDEQTVLTILATYLPDFVQKTAPTSAEGIQAAKQRGASQVRGSRSARGQGGQNSKPDQGLQGGAGEVVGHAD